MNDCVFAQGQTSWLFFFFTGSETVCEPAESECDLQQQQQPQTGSAAGGRCLKEHRNWNATHVVVIF